jgi:hypothetical protein
MNTAQDIVAYLLASTGGGAQDGEHAAVRQAVIHGVREVTQCRNWLWHTRTGSFTTLQIQTTGSITTGSKVIAVADATGFVPGRVVAVGASVFPTPIRIVSVNGNNVTVDVAANQTANGVTVLPQTYYDLPSDLKDIDTLVTNTVGSLHCYLTPQEWQRLEINTRGAGEPYYYTLMRSDLNPDRWQVRFVGVPVNGTVVHYTYRVRPKPIKYMGYERITRQGTITLAGSSVTGVGTAFPLDCAGAVIRFGSAGMEAEAQGATIPYLLERDISAVASATALTVANNSASLPANTKYAITDKIDVSPTMYTAILSACEMWYARIAGKPADAAMAVFNRDLRIAMENDVLAPRSGRPHSTPYPTPRSMGWHSELMPDIG